MHNEVLETAHCLKLATKHHTDTITGRSSNSTFFRLFCRKDFLILKGRPFKKTYGFKEFLGQLHTTLDPRHQGV
jgi:hypothetical protein